MILIGGSVWKWPNEWVNLFFDVLNVPVPSLNHDLDDRAVWVNNKGREKSFSVKEVWKGMRRNAPKVMWFKHVWFSQCIPRHAFVLWMAIKGKLKTQDRLSKWLNINDMLCPFCNSCKDSHSHLFFECAYSRRLWERLKLVTKLGDMSYIWGEVVSGMVNKTASNKIWSIIQRLAFGAVVYFIWQERNFRIFEKSSRSDDCLFSIIVENVRLRLMGLKILKTSPDVK